MKKQLLLLTLLISIHNYAQDQFKKGHFINNSNEKITCLIKDLDWKDNPTEFKYKLSEGGLTKNHLISNVKEFEIFETSNKYIRAEVDIDKSSSFINNLNYNREPVFEKEIVFLKVLVQGKASLFYYENESLNRFFFKVDHNKINQLIYKEFLKDEVNGNSIKENNDFRKQIYKYLKSNSITIANTVKLKYSKEPLVKKFIQYNKDNQVSYITFNNTTKKELFFVSVKLGLGSSSLKISNNESAKYQNVDIGKSTNVKFGVELEYILPFNNNKWSLIIEPTYQQYNKSSLHNYNDENKPIDTKYKSLELPIGARYYYYLNKKSKLFANAGIVYDFNFKNSEIQLNDSSFGLESLNIKSNSYNTFLGIGYKHNNKLSIEARYNISRSILNNYVYWDSNYTNLSMILGYTLF